MTPDPDLPARIRRAEGAIDDPDTAPETDPIASALPFVVVFGVITACALVASYLLGIWP